MPMYCFYQTDSKGAWHLSLASERHNLVKSKGAKLITALDVDNDFSTQLTAEENAALKQTGDLFFDFDEDLAVCIEQFKKFLVLLQSKSVNLDQCRFYASGGRGFHAFIPMQMFMPKVQPNGVTGLVHIYKEMAHALFIDGMDSRVYSSKKGRQLRCANVQRDNGLYKVQVTADEVFSMTVEKYAQICASPRNDLPIEQAEFNPDLGLLYATSQDRVNKALTKKKSRKPEADILKRFNGEWPETFNLILNGLGIKEGVGWNHISLQLAIAASALSKSEEQLLTDAEPLIQSHGGDSSRYNSANKRRSDLREMYGYISGNPCFEFAAGPILALLIPEVRANSDLAWGDWQPDASTKPKTVTAPVVETPQTLEGESAKPSTTEATGAGTGTAADDSDDVEDEDEYAQIRISRQGIFARSDDGYKRVCDIGIVKPVSFRKLDGDHIGYEVETFLDGVPKGKKHLPMSAFTSKAQMHAWALNNGAAMTGTDANTAALVGVLRKKAAKTDSIVYTLEREGVDLIVPPGCKTKGGFDVVWAAPGGVVSQGETKYRFHGIYGSDGYSETDLMDAPNLTLDDGQFIEDLLSINTDTNIAKLLGWFSAAFLTQLIRKDMRQFPLLQVFGQAEAGKSATVELMNGMHYYLHKPRQMSASGQTLFPILVAVGTSASIPVVFEEMKPRQMSAQNRNALQNIFRSNYRADVISRGSLGRDKAAREPTVTDFQNSAPIAFVGEAIEDQSAILGRCVVVSLSQADRMGKAEQFSRCVADAHTMGKIGKCMVISALTLTSEKVADEVRGQLQRVTETIPPELRDKVMRPTFNLAVVLTGLQFFGSVVSGVFGSRFDTRIKELQDSVLSCIKENIPRNLSEASRVIDVMAQLSRNTDDQYRMVPNVDYTINKDGKTMDLKLRTAYAKYVRWQRSLGMEVLFDNEGAFIAGMTNYAGTVRKSCPDNLALYDSPKAVIYRLNLAYLEKEEVDTFM